MNKIKKILLVVALINVFSFQLTAQKNGINKANDALKNESATTIQAGYDAYKTIALNIWDYAELGYKENKKSLKKRDLQIYIFGVLSAACFLLILKIHFVL